MNTDIAVQHAIDRLAKVGFEGLSKTESTIVAAWLFEAGILNQGLVRYYASKRGDLAFHVPEAFRSLGAPHLAQIATEANAVFGPGGPPRDCGARKEMVRQLSELARGQLSRLENKYMACDEDVDELMESFLARENNASSNH